MTAREDTSESSRIDRRAFLRRAALAAGAAPYLAAALAACAAPAPQARRTVKIAQSGQGAPFASVYLAQLKGFFSDEGLDVPEIASLAGALAAAMIAGEIDLGMGAAEGLTRLLEQGSTRTVIVEQFTNPTGRQMIVRAAFARERGIDPSQPIRERLAKLKGAIIGSITPGEDVRLFALRRAGGLGPDDVTKVAIPAGPGALLAALSQGRIDVFMWNPPFGPLAERQGVGKVIGFMTEIPEFKYPELVLSARRELVEKEPKVVESVVKAITRAKRFIAERTDEAIDALLPLFQGTDKALMQETFRILLPVTPIAKPMAREDWERMAQLQLATGELKAKVDTSEGVMWTNTFIQKVAAR